MALAEVTQRLVELIDDAAVVPVPVPAFDTVSAGFCAAQLALGGQDRGTGLVYVNVAPRADQPDPRPGNQGERSVAAFCDNGLPVVSVHAGYRLSFVRSPSPLLSARLPDSGSQFRSRDIFPAVVAELVSGRSDEAGPELPAELVPPPPAEAVCYVDGYGNLKATYTSAPVPAGAEVKVTVGGAVRVGRLAAGIEVLLDVVYNHTAEGNHLGPVLSFNGIDNAAYYHLDGDRRVYWGHERDG